MSALYLSRAQLKRDPAVEALTRVLMPDDSGARAYCAHRLVWSLFADQPDGKRDFLFRSEAPDARRSGRAQFFVLSRRLPNPDNPLLDAESKPFEPDLRAGDRLGFSLRANATRARQTPDGKTIRVDVVMDALHGQRDRSDARPKAIAEAGRAWLELQGQKSGFCLAQDDEGKPSVAIDGYEQWRFPGLGREGKIATLDFQGVLEVTDPTLFLGKLAEGFGRAKAFGCGLMLIRRA
jgi:CRISPR system Cascade subunit CasE